MNIYFTNQRYGGDRCRYGLTVFSAGTALETVKATEVQCRTETNVSEYSETVGFGSEIARIRQIRNSKVPIATAEV